MNQLFIVLLISGVMLIGAEVFVPGGVLGVIGAIALLAAAMIGFSVFPPAIATMVAFGMIILVGIVIALWIKIFPHTLVGRKMTVTHDLKDSKATEPGIYALIGKTGITLSPLHPSGYVEIENRRIDVVSQGEMINQGTLIRVKAVEGNRVIVEAADTPEI